MARMLLATILLAALAQAGALARGSAAVVGGVTGRGAHPIEDVIELLKGMKVKVEAEGGKEELSYSKFQTWCRVQVKDFSTKVAKHKNDIVAHDALSKSLGSRIEVLNAEKIKLDATISHLGIAAGGANTQRLQEVGLYKTKRKDLVDTIQALTAATVLLVTHKGSPGSFLQASLRSRLSDVMSALDAKATDQQRMVLRSPGDTATHDEHVQKKTFKSDTVIELLKELKIKFEDELQAVEEGETTALNAHGLEKQARDHLKRTKDDRKLAVDQEILDLGEEKTGVGGADQSLMDSKEGLKQDGGLLADIRRSCSAKETEWNRREKTRRQEVAAIETAISILSKVTGVRHEVPTNPVLPTRPVSVSALLLQISSSRPMSGVDKAIHLLRREAAAARSPELDHLVSWVAAHRADGHEAFTQVFIQIDKMIWALREEQTSEDKKKNWCEQELNKTKSAMDHHVAKVSALSKKNIVISAAVDEEVVTMANLQKELADLATFMKEATEARNIQTEENAKALKDSKDAQAALVGAIAELKLFYIKAGAESALLLQRKDQVEDPVEKPATWEAEYTGSAEAEGSGGAVKKLEDILVQFEAMESDVTSQEAEDSIKYKDEMKEAKIDAATKNQEFHVAETRKSQGVKKSGDLQAREKAEELKHYNVKQTLKHLEKPCGDVMGDAKYGTRKEHRTTEIAGLVAAKACLQDVESSACTGAHEETDNSVVNEVQEGFLQRKGRSLRGNVLAPMP